MSGRYQASLILLLIIVSAISEANIIGRSFDNFDTANYYFGLARELEQRALENCPTCPDCPAPPTCPACPSFVRIASFTVCPAATTYETTYAREGVIDLSALSATATCNFAIWTLSPYTKVRVKCPFASRSAGITINVGRLPNFTPTALATIEETVSGTNGGFVFIRNNAAGGSVKCTWVAE